MENNIKKLTTEILPSYSTEELAKMSYVFRERNWTSQGTCVYLKWSIFSQEEQNEMRQLIMDNVGNVMDEVFYEYDTILHDEIVDEWDLTEELEGVEVDSDEYYEIIESIKEDTYSLNPFHIHFCLMCVDLIEKSLDN
jgi:hypothetical protein